MALVKNDSNQQLAFPEYGNLEECETAYQESSDIRIKHHALTSMLDFHGGNMRLVELMDVDSSGSTSTAAYIASLLARIEPKAAPIEEILEVLKSDSAYSRNLAISILQSYGREIKYYIVKYLIGDGRDLRIFAINVLGDVNFAESRDMLLELLEGEQDINVAMTAVDYLGEIGQSEDVALLESLKERFKNEPYAEFAINKAIKAIRG